MSDRPPRFITPQGFARIRAKYQQLFGEERPKLVETISWAAANGDRSENGDYIYGRKRLREIDRRLGYLSKVMKGAKVVDPAAQASRDQVRFGATVELADENDMRRVLTLVGDDEADAGAGRIGWSAPLARALVGARVGDERVVRLPAGEKSYEVIAITYPSTPANAGAQPPVTARSD
jgi:transcription elongation factor GreB